jgi:hypothetical protein
MRIKVGGSDRSKIDQYLEAVRDIERRMQLAEKQSQGDQEVPLGSPVGAPEVFSDYFKLMADLMVVSWQTDMTRVITFQMGHEMSGRAYPELGFGDAHHPCTHHQGDPEKQEKTTKINGLHTKMLSYYLSRLKETSDGDGSLLDHSMILYGAGLSDANLHLYTDLSLLLVAGGVGGIKGGQHVRYPLRTPMTNLLLTLLDKANVPHVDSLGDSTVETRRNHVAFPDPCEASMTKFKLEYIWLDGYAPVPNLRGKTQIKEFAEFPALEQLPLWGFDGSSTMQAEGRSSDCVLKPVAVYPDPVRTNGALVMCEVMMPDGVTPHESNKRATIIDDEGAWFGFEQEYFFYKNGRPLGFPESGFPAPQGPYYTGVGYKNVGDIARQIVEEHLDLCLEAGINHEGINAEVAKGQWEFQVFGKGSRKAADVVWMARYLLQRLTE